MYQSYLNQETEGYPWYLLPPYINLNNDIEIKMDFCAQKEVS